MMRVMASMLLRNDLDEAAMTVQMTSNVDYDLAEIADDVVVNSGNSDPMSMIEQLPEVGVPVSLLVPDRKSTRLNSSHLGISYAVFCLKKKKLQRLRTDSESGHNPAASSGTVSSPE